MLCVDIDPYWMGLSLQATVGPLLVLPMRAGVMSAEAASLPAGPTTYIGWMLAACLSGLLHIKADFLAFLGCPESPPHSHLRPLNVRLKRDGEGRTGSFCGVAPSRRCPVQHDVSAQRANVF